MSKLDKQLKAPVDRKAFLKTASAAGLALLALGVGAKKRVAAARGVARGAKWGMAVDLRRCTGCRTCTVACKSENEVPLGVFRTYVHYLETGKYPDAKRFFAYTGCNHCDKPPCVEACPVDPVNASFKRKDGVKVSYRKKATYKRPDGVVLWDNERCIGCHMCVEACPYKARFVDPTLKAGGYSENQGIGKCTYCAHRLDNGVEPSCAQTCVGGALIFGDLNDSSSRIARFLKENRADVWKPEKGTGPNTYYVGLKNKAVLGQEVHPA